MLTFVSQPQDFTPLESGIIYHITSDTYTPLNISIVKSITGEVIGKKVVGQTTDVKVDIAPYLVGHIAREPKLNNAIALTPLAAESFHIEVTTATETLVSDTVTVSCNLAPLADTVIQSVFDTNRIICHGEQEDILLLITETANVEARFFTSTNQRRSTFLRTEPGLINLHIDTSMLDPEATYFTVDIIINGQGVETLYYNFVLRHSKSMRLMWLTAAGAIEHHTFATTLNCEQRAERKAVNLSQSGVQSIEVLSSTRLTLHSAALSSEMADAVASIIRSPRVWIEEPTPVAVDVLTQSLTTVNGDKAAVIKLQIETKPKTITL